MGTPLRLALVGCGSISGRHTAGYGDLVSRGCDEFLVTACCDLDAERAEERATEIAGFQSSKPTVFTDIDKLVASGAADAADVCLPHCFHHTAAIALLGGGLHVMLEKPLGITVKASKIIIEAAKQNGCVLATAENIRRHVTARSCAWAIKQKGLIGEVRLVSVQSIALQPFNYEKPAFKWRGLKLLTGGGMIMDSGAHLCDMMQVLFGEVDEVYCTMNTYDNRIIKDAPVLGDAPADVEDTWHAVIRFGSGLHVIWTYSRTLHGGPPASGTYHGSKGTMNDLGMVFHPFQGGGSADLPGGTTVSSEQIQSEYLSSLTDDEKGRLFPYGATEGIAIEVWDFVDAVLTGRKPEMDGYDGLIAKTLCETCYESATAGRPVKFQDVLNDKVNEYQKPINEFWGI